MVIIGRVTKDAAVTTLKDERKVLNFTIAVNDWYKPKGQEKGIQITTYFNCSYWISTALAEKLKKGTLVELAGRISVNAYTSMQGEAKASLNFHVNSITVHQFIKGEVVEEKEPVKDDLPF